MQWLDRVNQKKIILDWINIDYKPFLLTVIDSQEFEDITEWIGIQPNLKTSISYLNTDSEVTRFGLLESIVNEIGPKQFQKFTNLFESLNSLDIKLIVNQKIGSEIQNESSIKFENNNQIINFYNPDPESLRRFFLDSKINEFLNLFMNGLDELINKSTLIVCRFRGNGFDSLDLKFKSWFQEQFIRKMKFHKIRLLVLCEKNADQLINVFDFQNRYYLGDLELPDILPLSKQYLQDEGGFFCKGIVNESNKIPYNLFKFKLQKNISV